jgi:menaquinone-specific isochorismate synthase
VSEPTTDLGTSDPAGESAPLVVRTLLVDDAGPLLDLLPTTSDVTAWVRRGEGLVGWGTAAICRTNGPDRFARARAWWRDLAGSAVVRDEASVPGSGLVCFGSVAFADEPGDSVLVVPEVVVGRRGSTTWVTTTGVGAIPAHPDLTPAEPPAAPSGVTFADGALTGTEWETVVAEAVRRINAGTLEKVVLARDLYATAREDVDVRWPLGRLATSYPMCWTFHVDGLFGATPEMLVRRERGLVTSRVLAGTIRRTGNDTRDLALAASLARSSKDLEEHEYAVRSVATALAPHCTGMNVPDGPFVLHLPNVMHLATDVTGVLHDQASALRLAGALHPSAAVCGTPTTVAQALIAQIEGISRGRYAGPVGWIGAGGDGELGIALRCAQRDPADATILRLFAGCGIVAGSDPAAELAESVAKTVPMRDALAAD